MDFDDLDQGMPLGERVYHLKVGGLSMMEISVRLKTPIMDCAREFRAFQLNLVKVADLETRPQAVAMEMDRLDRLQSAHWKAATEDHDELVTIGRGDQATSVMVTKPPSIDAAKMVLAVMAQRAKLNGWDQLPPDDQAVTQTILVIGQNQAEYIAALQEGRRPALASADPDNDVEGQVVGEELDVDGSAA